MQATDNLRIKNLHPLISPSLLLQEQPLSDRAKETVIHARHQIEKIMHGQDDRLVIVVGPCSIHDPEAALEYAKRLKHCVDEYANELCIVMRVYFEKPRTTIGWKGLINDPNLDDSFDINRGLHTARHLLLEINHLGVPTGSEFLDTIIPQYISDLTSWTAIGARTTESQIHRELASGLSMPVGFKNSTTGDIQAAIDAINAAKHPHHFLGINKQGIAAIISTSGNHSCHVILRGGNTGPNYDATTISKTYEHLRSLHLNPRIMVDCSHGNSNKDHTRQMLVVKDLVDQLVSGSQAIFGLMLESNLVAGKQVLSKDHPLTYGQSITDACIDWEHTEKLLKLLHETVIKMRNRVSA